MICETVEKLTPIIGTRPACRAVGASVATVYRRRRRACAFFCVSGLLSVGDTVSEVDA
jgi:hypothetical protein